jgi:hypothetical protein
VTPVAADFAVAEEKVTDEEFHKKAASRARADPARVGAGPLVACWVRTSRQLCAAHGGLRPGDPDPIRVPSTSTTCPGSGRPRPDRRSAPGATVPPRSAGAGWRRCSPADGCAYGCPGSAPPGGRAPRRAAAPGRERPGRTSRRAPFGVVRAGGRRHTAGHGAVLSGGPGHSLARASRCTPCSVSSGHPTRRCG